jgi:hypothetical protein
MGFSKKFDKNLFYLFYRTPELTQRYFSRNGPLQNPPEKATTSHFPGNLRPIEKLQITLRQFFLHFEDIFWGNLNRTSG